ncbi:unnamed protein product [Rhodiola kirilowii]
MDKSDSISSPVEKCGDEAALGNFVHFGRVELNMWPMQRPISMR